MLIVIPTIAGTRSDELQEMLASAREPKKAPAKATDREAGPMPGPFALTWEGIEIPEVEPEPEIITDKNIFDLIG